MLGTTDHESTTVPLAAFRQTPAVPIHPNTTLLDPRFWGIADQRAQARRLKLLRARMEVQSYFAIVGQSTREDYHRAFADIYGMAAIHTESWSNGYTSFEALAYLLNRVQNRNEGKVVTHTKRVTLTSEPYPIETWVPKPVARVNGALALLDLFASYTGNSVRSLPSWRIRRNHQGDLVADVLQTVWKERPSEERSVPVTEELPAEWYNPVQVEDAFTILEDSMHRHLRSPGCEGLSVVIDKHERMHVVYWETARFEYTQKGRDGRTYVGKPRIGKRPLAVQSLPLGTTDDDARRTMREVAGGMTRTCRDGLRDEVPGWLAAVLDDERIGRNSAPDITGSHEWLALVADQRESGEVYRSHGAESDD